LIREWDWYFRHTYQELHKLRARFGERFRTAVHHDELTLGFRNDSSAQKATIVWFIIHYVFKPFGYMTHVCVASIM